MASSNAAGWLGLYNVDAQDRSSTLLEANKLPDQTHIDGIAPDGLHVLYHYADKGNTGYHVLTEVGKSKVFYSLANNEARNALWLPDSRHVLISTAHHGVLMVDSTNSAVTSLLPQINAEQLVVYRYPYLYFLAGAVLQEGALYRVNVADHKIQLVIPHLPDARFWLSPDGLIMYYSTQDSQGETEVYASDSNGVHQRLLSSDGVPIGFADNDGLLLMRESDGKFQVVQITGANASTTHSRIVLDDVAPGAAALCDQAFTPTAEDICASSVALAPQGKSLLVEASYSDKSRQLLSVDLTTGKRVQVSSIPAQIHTHIALVGWDRVSAEI